MTAGFALLQRILRETAGLSIDGDKMYLVEDRLRPILRDAGLKSLDDLAHALYRQPRCELARRVTEALTINETSFFRDRSLFTQFTDRLLPDLIEARHERRRLRIWCVGCSSGQEPYSLAMLIDENARRLAGWRVEIVGSDLSRTMIERARLGLYSQFEVQRGLPVAMLLRYFRREGEEWRISEHLRAKISFRAHNLVTETCEVERFDVIFCRNVLLYFDVDLKRRVLTKLEAALADDGVLALGAAETVAGLCPRLRPHASHFLFRKTPAEPGATRLRA